MSCSLRSFGRHLSFPVGAVLAGIAAGQAAAALGHDSSAGYPFPDFWGITLSWSCVILAPPAALLMRAVANHFMTNYHLRLRVSGVFAMLVIAPLLGMTVGLIAQSKENHRCQISSEFDAVRQRAYRSFFDQIMADPGIAIREKWYEKPDPLTWSPELAARAMVFSDSFKPKHGPAPYTLPQLEELSKVSPDARLLVPSHPNCSVQMIEEAWPEIMDSGQSSAMEAIILNPSTPRFLLERYAKERNLSENDSGGWVGRLILERLDEEMQN